MPEAVVLAEHESDKHGHYWQCIGSEADSLIDGGRRYFFSVRPEKYVLACDFEAQKEMYPALEPFAAAVFGQYPGPVIDKLPDSFQFWDRSGSPMSAPLGNAPVLSENQRIAVLLHFLGFGSEGENFSNFKLILPDPATVCGRWALLRKQNPNLPELKILPAAGIASHLDFVKAYIDYDALVSTGAEFVHDVAIHVRATVEFMFKEGSNYHNEKAKYVKRIEPFYKLLTAYYSDPKLREAVPLSEKELESLALSLGIEADNASAVQVVYHDAFAALYPGPQSTCIPRCCDLSNPDDNERRLLNHNEKRLLNHLLEKNGIRTKEDGLVVSLNWDKLKWAAVETFGVSEISLNSALCILESAKAGAHVVSQNRLYVKSDTLVRSFPLNIQVSDDGAEKSYNVTMPNKEIKTLKGQFDCGLPADFIAEILDTKSMHARLCALFASRTPVAPEAVDQPACSP